MYVEEIRFPDGVEAQEKDCGDWYTIINKENAEWEVSDWYILIRITVHDENYDATICIGKDVDQLYGDKKEIVDRINNHVSNFFTRRAQEKDLYYRY